MYSSIDISKEAIKMAISSWEEEKEYERTLKNEGIKVAAVDIGGSLNESILKIVERALVASKRSGVIKDTHVEDGAIAGATRDAISQVSGRANNLNVGGKIGIARGGEHICVAIFLSIGLLHLNEVVIGLGHRSLQE